MELEQWNSVFQQLAAGLGEDQWTLEPDGIIEPKQNPPGSYEYIRTTFAEFRCSLCRRGWPSKRVMMIFHYSLNSSLHRGTVKVRGFKQKCRRCSAARMESPRFSRQNVDVILEKLVEKIKIRCYGEERQEPYRNLHFSGKVEGPHERAHCEGCLRGFCKQDTQTLT